MHKILINNYQRDLIVKALNALKISNADMNEERELLSGMFADLEADPDIKTFADLDEAVLNDFVHG